MKAQEEPANDGGAPLSENAPGGHVDAQNPIAHAENTGDANATVANDIGASDIGASDIGANDIGASGASDGASIAKVQSNGASVQKERRANRREAAPRESVAAPRETVAAPRETTRKATATTAVDSKIVASEAAVAEAAVASAAPLELPFEEPDAAAAAPAFESISPAMSTQETPVGETSAQQAAATNDSVDAAAIASPRAVRLPEMRENRDERPVVESRIERGGLRFRGREGRAEVRSRGEVRGRVPLRSRPEIRDNRSNDNGRVNDNRGNDNRNEARGDGRDGSNRDNDSHGGGNGRLAHFGRNDNRDNARDYNRDGSNRDNGNRGNDNRGNDNRDNGRASNRDEMREMRSAERDFVRGRNDLDLTTLEDKNVTELREIAKDMGITAAAMKKSDLVFRILEAQAETSGNAFKQGILEILSDGKGFLRTEGYLAGEEDVYVSQSQIKRFNLRTGDIVSGQVRAPKEMERYYGLLRVEATNGEAPDISRARKEFEKLTPIFPNEKFKLETTQENITARIIDLITPIGKGQRGLIVAPAKAGKTSLIKNIANSIAANHPEITLIVLLIDERPEEVTDISRSVKGEVVASTFDELPENHMRVADMVMEKAKRMVEQKKDVVILMDSITRLSRASNLVVTPSGRTLAGGLDPAAMYRPKRMFGAARNIEEGGSLTILATALVDTGSRMDDMIFEEFKGTGNMDLILDRSLFDQRIFPAIDINKSGTRRDDLLLSKEDLAATFHLRRTLSALDNDKAINLLIDRLKNTKTNADFMQIVAKSSLKAATQ